MTAAHARTVSTRPVTTLPTNRATSLHDPNDMAAFNADVTTPDHAVVSPGESFRKIWEIQNLGTRPWRGRRVVRVDGEYALARRLSDGCLEAGEGRQALFQCLHLRSENEAAMIEHAGDGAVDP